MEQVVVAEACTARGWREIRPSSGARRAARGVRLPGAQRSPARRTGDRAQYTAHHHVQIRDDDDFCLGPRLHAFFREFIADLIDLFVLREARRRKNDRGEDAT